MAVAAARNAASLAGHRRDLLLARGRRGHQLQVAAETLGRVDDDDPIIDGGVEHGPERRMDDADAAASEREPDLLRDAVLGDLLDPPTLEQLGQEGLDVALLEEPALYTALARVAPAKARAEALRQAAQAMELLLTGSQLGELRRARSERA